VCVRSSVQGSIGSAGYREPVLNSANTSSAGSLRDFNASNAMNASASGGSSGSGIALATRSNSSTSSSSLSLTNAVCSFCCLDDCVLICLMLLACLQTTKDALLAQFEVTN
jgi:hypothetical protein